MFAAYVPSPESREAADSIVQSLIQNLPRQADPVSKSIRFWDQVGCHHFAQSVKNCHAYSERNVLGDTLRSLANNAIITEHRRALAI